jgi:hypothetical protein
MAKAISSAAINALEEALVNIYWYKNDLERFLRIALNNPQLLQRLDFNNYSKRDVVSYLIDFMASNQNLFQDDLISLMAEVIKITDFSHLERLEDGQNKAKKAKTAVKALHSLYITHEELINEQKASEERRRIVKEKAAKYKGVQTKLEELKKVINELVVEKDAQKRGFKLETIITELFNLYDLDSRPSFRIQGEQIDGAFTFEKTDYLFEAKWTSKQIDREPLSWFSEKVSNKLDNTLGLFLSINGFTDSAINLHKGRSLIILMDGQDLMAVLEGRISLLDLLLRKRRHAAQTGEIFISVVNIIKE